MENLLKHIAHNPIDMPKTNDTANGVFRQLIGETGSRSLSANNSCDLPENLVEKIDRLMITFRNRNTPILPSIELLNEAARAYIDCRQVQKARVLMEQMHTTYGVRPNDNTLELMASLELKTGQLEKAASIMRSLKTVSSFGQEICNSIILSYFKRSQDSIAWGFFDDLRAKVIPSPSVSSTMLTRCGKLNLVEKAFLVYKQLSAQGLSPNSQCNSALIFAASKRKEYFSTAIDLFRQMNLLKMPISLPVYNHLLYACGKVSDLKTALNLWEKLLLSEDKSLKPNEYTCCNFLWALASVETKDQKLSKRDFVYDMTSKSVVEAAGQVYDYIKSNGILLNAHILNALLAIYSNNGRKQESETIFWETLPAMGLQCSPYTYELAFKLYDNISDYKAAKTVYEQLRKDPIKVPYEGWRALSRTAALCGELEMSLKHLNEMIGQGYKPHIDDFKTLKLKFYESDREDLVKQLEALCEKPEKSPNPFIPWLRRSQAISKVLKDVYGDKAPDTVTKICN